MKALHIIAWILIVVGAINWGLIGLGDFAGGDWNVVHMILGSWPQLEWLVYILVGISGVWELVAHRKNCRMCSSSGSMSM